MFATLTTECWSSASNCKSIRVGCAPAKRSRKAAEVRALLAEIGAPVEASAPQTTISLPAELDRVLDRWLARVA